MRMSDAMMTKSTKACHDIYLFGVVIHSWWNTVKALHRQRPISGYMFNRTSGGAMTRMLLGLLISMIGIGSATGQTRRDRPNMVIFIGDDLAAGDIGPYGSRVVRTPNLDRLGKEALVFRRAFAASATCAPSRSSLFTGLYPMRHGGHGNHAGVNPGTLSFVQVLGTQGYRVAIAGKLHVGPRSVFPFDYIEGTNVPEPGFETRPGLHYDLNLEPVDRWLAERRSDEPFVLIVADHSPHVVWPETAEYTPAEMDIPPIHVDTEDTRRARARYFTDISKMDTNLGTLLRLLDKHGLSDDALVVFTADQGPQWPFGKWGLYDYGVQVPLMVRWPGKVVGGTQTEALVSLVDILPTFAAIAGATISHPIDGRSFLHVLRNSESNHREMVFASHTGDGMMNRSPMRMLRTERFKYILNLAPEGLYTTHMDRATDHDGGREYWPSWRDRSFRDQQAANVLWRYHHRPQEELYDVLVDPWEQVNLASDPAYADTIAEFRSQMSKIREEQGDRETGPEDLNAKRQRSADGPAAPYVF